MNSGPIRVGVRLRLMPLWLGLGSGLLDGKVGRDVIRALVQNHENALHRPQPHKIT